MSTPDSIQRLLAVLPHLTPEGIQAARRDWRESNPMRQILLAEADRLVEIARTELEGCAPEELQPIQGRIAGHREMIAAIKAQGPQ